MDPNNLCAFCGIEPRTSVCFDIDLNCVEKFKICHIRTLRHFNIINYIMSRQVELDRC